MSQYAFRSKNIEKKSAAKMSTVSNKYIEKCFFPDLPHGLTFVQKESKSNPFIFQRMAGLKSCSVNGQGDDVFTTVSSTVQVSVLTTVLLPVSLSF